MGVQLDCCGRGPAGGGREDSAATYRGPAKDTILQILGGIRSSCTYVGAKSLKEISKRTTFIRVTAQLNEIFSGNPAPLAAPKSPHISARLADDRLAHESPNLKRAKAD